MRPAGWIRPAVFGTFDGLTAVLGVLLSLAHRPGLILPAAAGLAVAEGVGMFAGEWLSESGSGVGAAVVIGAATAAGSLLPAVPYAVLAGWVAVGVSGAVFVALAVGIAGVRASERGWRRSLLETFGVLVAAVLAVAVCVAVTPGGTA